MVCKALQPSVLEDHTHPSSTLDLQRLQNDGAEIEAETTEKDPSELQYITPIDYAKRIAELDEDLRDAAEILVTAVSYTHLDVYKRQVLRLSVQRYLMIKRSPIARVPFISQSRRIGDYQDLSETIENQTLPSRPRTRIFTLQEEQVHLQPGQ